MYFSFCQMEFKIEMSTEKSLGDIYLPQGFLVKHLKKDEMFINNCKARHLPLGSDIKGGGEGRHTVFIGYRTFTQLAVTELLMELRMPATMAIEKAAEFAHFGNGPLGDLPERYPSLPFHTDHGSTIFGVSKEATAFEISTPGRDAYKKLSFKLNKQPFIAVDVTKVFIRVFNAIAEYTGDPDLTPGKVLDAAYPALADCSVNDGNF